MLLTNKQLARTSYRENQAKALFGAQEELTEIIHKRQIRSVFQPIVDLRSGEIMGYEALTRGPENSAFFSPVRLFEAAGQFGMILELEKICREEALKHIGKLTEQQQLFINISAEVVKDSNFKPGETKRFIQKQGLQPQQITFEITERTAICDFATFTQSLNHYRQQGYCIAVDDAGAGYSSLQSIVELRPDYIKLDSSIIKDIDQNSLKQAVLSAMVKLATGIKSKIIAEGIERPEELNYLIHTGVTHGQGYFLARPGFPAPQITAEAKKLIADINFTKQQRKKRNEKYGYDTTVIDITQFGYTVPLQASVCDIQELFIQTQSNYVVVLSDERPVGLIMKHKLYYRLGPTYDGSLFVDIPVEQVMDTAPLILDAELSLDSVSDIAMSRSEDSLYDIIIVTKDGRYEGIVTIMNLLNHITKMRVCYAHDANPLTGFPGNVIIEDKIQSLMYEKAKFSLLYIDIDNFKAYSDKYGFVRGDEIILLTAKIIGDVLASQGHGDDFIGHIGGDDFIVITKPESARHIAGRIISKFDEEISSYYYPEDLSNGYIEVANRRGQLERFSILSLSIAIVSNVLKQFSSYVEIGEEAARLKKIAKRYMGSSYASLS